jgi:hypothetical protein
MLYILLRSFFIHSFDCHCVSKLLLFFKFIKSLKLDDHCTERRLKVFIEITFHRYLSIEQAILAWDRNGQCCYYLFKGLYLKY